MGSQISLNRLEEDVTNDILIQSNQSCSATCNNVIEGTTIIVSGRVKDININQQCTASTAGCVMSSTLDAQLDNILSSISDQEQSFTDSMISFVISSQVDENDVKQIIHNKLSNISNAVCNANSSNLNSNTLVYVTGTGGDINISQSGDAIASCIMDVMSKISVFNSQAAENTQAQTRENVFVALFSSIGGIILVAGIILILVLFLPKILDKAGGTGKAVEAKGGAEAGPESGGALAQLKTMASGISKSDVKAAVEGILPEVESVVAANPELLALL
uniref:Lipid membrane protein n=1 Tax=Pithovirus LCPAC404 TaxID=2506597 RepID=A0A481ZCX7_9VIRU|nr:MAG: lipid membrane protein [Pithovirus LCPAC404]